MKFCILWYDVIHSSFSFLGNYSTATWQLITAMVLKNVNYDEWKVASEARKCEYIVD